MNEPNPYQVKLDTFEGPLDLLLHLIQRYEIDIYDIPVAQITEQYLQYLHAMQTIELNIASEYLVMAATLVAIKSQMLLPKQKLEEEEEYIEDPREALMQRLIEYRKYKEAAERLKEKESDESKIYTRPPYTFNDLQKSVPVERGSISIYDMVGALTNVLQRKKWNAPLETTINQREVTLEEKMLEINDVLKNNPSGVLFDQLFVYKAKAQIVVTFMAILELMKNNKVYCKQERHFDSIYVFLMEE
ncbi:segregation/condensation protein A [Virgibacillus sp. W0430]|uniref:segregation/condensation protein A n=1 Tax=Virgibacillus sp. W0430 TaxID=3391580 RepID=UPI003F451773